MRTRLVLVIIVLAGIMPFASRAVYLDEHIFLHVARSVHNNWSFPHDTPWVFFGTRVPNLAAHTHPPVGEYYLALLYGVFGKFHEVPFRLAFSVFPIAAVLGFYSLARRFTQHPFTVAVLFALTPAFFVYGPTVMMDIPMLAFLLVGFAFYFAHLSGRRYMLPAASLCFVLAAGTGYTALVPLACLLIGQIAARRPIVEMLSVCAAPVALALWLAAMTVHFAEFPLVRTASYYAAQGDFTRNILGMLSFLGGVTLFPGFAGGTRRTIIGSIVIATALTYFAVWPSLSGRAWYILLATSGLLLLAAFLHKAHRLVSAGKNNGQAVFLLWVPAVLLFFAVIADMINARYLMLVVPPLYLVLFAETEQRRLIYTLVPTAALSLVLAYADFISVNMNRDLVEQTIVPLQRQGFRVWSGAESGLRFYLEQTGASTLATQDTGVGAGELIVRHQGLFGYSLAEAVATRLIVIKTLTLNSAFPVRTYSAPAGAGFHDTGAGLVPFSFSREPYDRIEIAQMSPLTPAAVWSPKGPVFIQTEAEHDVQLGIPSDIKIEYEVDGDGTLATTENGIRLIKGDSPTAVWTNFRIVPKDW